MLWNVFLRMMKSFNKAEAAFPIQAMLLRDFPDYLDPPIILEVTHFLTLTRHQRTLFISMSMNLFFVIPCACIRQVNVCYKSFLKS